MPNERQHVASLNCHGDLLKDIACLTSPVTVIIIILLLLLFIYFIYLFIIIIFFIFFLSTLGINNPEG